MIGKKLWERYFLKELLKIFFLFVFSFYGLYFLVDYSSRSTASYASKASFFEILNMYAWIFVQRIEIIIPFALMVAAIKTLSSLNIRNELVALQAVGIELKVLMRPFILVAFCLTMFMYLNAQYFVPMANKEITYLKDKHLDQKDVPSHKQNVEVLEVIDQGELIFHSYDTVKKSFFDVFWIKSLDEIYRIKFLYPYGNTPVGRFVDKFTRSEEGDLLLVQSEDIYEFEGMRFNLQKLRQTIINPRNESITTLVSQVIDTEQSSESYLAGVETVLFHKLFMPWLCILAVIGPATWCLRFTRQLPLFMIYLVSMITMVTFYLIMNAALILGESSVITPFFAIATPFLGYSAFFGWKYLRTV